ncbi:hypothetical protein [Pseudochrobactrum sp. MP213Fo]|uniref:hypothetical protein n=1 Tax=Pseudochrobactrum sp. MP213Fo TaxID=3022250 RepID=UPI003BA39441
MEVMLAPKGGDRKSDQKQKFVSDRHEAAEKAGFGNYETARQAKAVVSTNIYFHPALCVLRSHFYIPLTPPPHLRRYYDKIRRGY